MVLRGSWTGLRPVGPAHVFEHGLTLLVHKPREQLLRVPEHQRPGQDLRGGVQCGEARDELTAHEQQAEEGGNGASWELERGVRNRQAISL